jgi:hypothetical protein
VTDSPLNASLVKAVENSARSRPEIQTMQIKIVGFPPMRLERRKGDRGSQFGVIAVFNSSSLFHPRKQRPKVFWSCDEWFTVIRERKGD